MGLLQHHCIVSEPMRPTDTLRAVRSTICGLLTSVIMSDLMRPTDTLRAVIQHSQRAAVCTQACECVKVCVSVCERVRECARVRPRVQADVAQVAVLMSELAVWLRSNSEMGPVRGSRRRAHAYKESFLRAYS
jgi:hypothetical protein